MNDSLDKKKWAELLKSVEFFKPFVDGELDNMLKSSLVKKYQAREIIIKENHDADTFYVILTGNAKVIKKTNVGISRTVMTLSVGDCFGEMAILLDEPRVATIVSDSDCTVFVIKKGEINKLPIETREKLYREFAVMISRRLKYNLQRL